MLEKIHDILHFWFGEPDDDIHQVAKTWWQKDDAFDAKIRNNFEETLVDATHGKLDIWLDQPISCLAYIILLDQFPRNIYRGTPQAFSYDDKARQACKLAIDNEHDKYLSLIQRQFVYMPLQHSEDLEDQKYCVALFQKLLDLAERDDSIYIPLMRQGLEYAIKHHEVIEAYGRFPHRNEILGRENTEEEIEYLKRPDSGF